jgi:hypothetical protein
MGRSTSDETAVRELNEKVDRLEDEQYHPGGFVGGGGNAAVDMRQDHLRNGGIQYFHEGGGNDRHGLQAGHQFAMEIVPGLVSARRLSSHRVKHKTVELLRYKSLRFGAA